MEVSPVQNAKLWLKAVRSLHQLLQASHQVVTNCVIRTRNA
jgi:hypothetical protein